MHEEHALEAQLEQLERQFWTGGSQFYEQSLASDAVMVFADPVGVLDRERVVESVTAAPRWTGVELQDVRFTKLARGVMLMTYRARAKRRGDPSHYAARASSAYVHRDGRWQLIFHQQTPHAEP